MEDWIKAGKITAECINYAKELVGVGLSYLETAEKIEKNIFDLGGKCAFPVNISVNEIAAHDTPFMDDKRVFKEGDLVKIDIGVSVNGAIGDSAVTIDLGDNKELVKASEKALSEAIKVIKLGVELREIGKKINEAIKSFGFNPIKNLSGHGLDRYKVHTGLNIPNYDNLDNKGLERGYIAIEPFATTGGGKIAEGKRSGIYKLEKVKPVRNNLARDLLKFISKEYQTLPFAKRWLKSFKALNFSLNALEKEGIIKEYPLLVESSKGMVSQAEHTLYIGKEVKVLTR